VSTFNSKQLPTLALVILLVPMWMSFGNPAASQRGRPNAYVKISPDREFVESVERICGRDTVRLS